MLALLILRLLRPKQFEETVQELISVMNAYEYYVLSGKDLPSQLTEFTDMFIRDYKEKAQAYFLVESIFTFGRIKRFCLEGCVVNMRSEEKEMIKLYVKARSRSEIHKRIVHGELLDAFCNDDSLLIDQSLHVYRYDLEDYRTF